MWRQIKFSDDTHQATFNGTSCHVERNDKLYMWQASRGGNQSMFCRGSVKVVDHPTPEDARTHAMNLAKAFAEVTLE